MSMDKLAENGCSRHNVFGNCLRCEVEQLEIELERVTRERDEWLRKAGNNGKFYMETLAERDKAIETIRKAFAELGEGESFEAYKTLKLGVKI